MKRGKDALFAWCKAVTAGYRGIEIKDFHMSWRDGLAFCAIIHRYRPDLINYNSLNKDEPLKNHALAFSVAEDLGIPPLLDPEDMLVAPTPEPLSVMTYLSQFFHYFSGQKGAGIAVISHTDETSPAAFAFSRPDANSNTNTTSAPAAGPAKTSTAANNTTTARTASTAPTPARDTRTESTTARATPTPAVPKINTALKPEAQAAPIGNRSPRLSHGNSIAETEAPVCSKCSKQVSGQTIEWMGNLYHKECFGCTTCNKQFRNNCLNIDGKPYCESCGRKAFIASKLAKRNGDADSTPQQSSSATVSKPEPTVTANKTTTTAASDTRAPSTSVSTNNAPSRTAAGSVSVPRTGSNVGSATNRPLNIIEQEALREQEREKERELERQRLAGKSVSDADKRKREEEERRKREEEEKKKREEEEKKKREAEEKKKRGEEEKRRTLEEDRRKREEEEKKKREELERKRREDDEKRRTLEDEKRKTAESDRKKREEEERRKRLEEEERRRTLEEEKRRKVLEEEARSRRLLEEEENRKRAQAEEEERRRRTVEDETRRRPREESSVVRPQTVEDDQRLRSESRVLQAIEEARQKKKAEEEEKRRQREEARLRSQAEEQRRRADTIRAREEEKLKRELDDVKRQHSGSVAVVSPRKTGESDLQQRLREQEEERDRVRKQLELKNQEVMRMNEENEREMQRLRERRLSRNTSQSSGSFEREKAAQEQIEAAIQARKQSERKPVLGKWTDGESNNNNKGPEWQVRAQSVQEKYRTNSELPIVNNNNNNTYQDMNYYKAKKYDSDLDEEFDRKINKRQTRVRNFVWEDFLESNKLKGFMMKRDPNGIFGGKWRRRYFVLREARLLYYRQEPPASSVGTNHPPLGIISLQYSSSIEPEGNGKIKIVTPDRVWRLDAGNNQEREKWIKGLREAKEIYTLVKNKIDAENVPIYGPNYEARKEGILQRYNAIYFWVENYFALQDGMLFYFASKGANQKGRVPLYDAKFEEYAVTNKFSFKIVWKENGKKNEIVLAAKSEEEMQAWCTALLKQKLLIEDTINSIEF